LILKNTYTFIQSISVFKLYHINFFHNILSKISIAISNMYIEIMMWFLQINFKSLTLQTKSSKFTCMKFSILIFNIWVHISFKWLFIIMNCGWITHICFNCIKLSLNILFIFSITIHTPTSVNICSFLLFVTMIVIICERILWSLIHLIHILLEIFHVIFWFNILD
jgi:hypothetical protein